MHTRNILNAGIPASEAAKALILVHGRGADARSILELAAHLNVDGYSLFAPQATNHTWYPLSFLARPDQNEPWLTSALELLKDLTDEIVEAGIAAKNIYFLGFSQGACLTLEYVTRHAKNYGGVVTFTGGLIGDKLYEDHYLGDFMDTPFFISTGDPDPHVPLERVKESVRILKNLNARVELKVYDNRPHTISQDEIDRANELIFK